MKNGIDFFPLDTVLDNKFKLIEAEFGLEGFAVVVKLLQYIYGEGGYYGEVNDDVVLLFSRNIGLGGNTVTEIINGAIRRGIFNKELYDKYRILTSEGIQKRYFNIVKRRQNVKVIKEYLLGDYIQNLDNVNISQKNVNNYQKSVNISAQSKVKESKVKESKVFISPLGKFCNVLLTEEEYNSLQAEVKNRDDYIERLSNYIEKTGKKYKSHYAAILSWFKDDMSKQTRKETLSIETSYNIDEYKEKTNKQTLKYERKNYNENHT